MSRKKVVGILVIILILGTAVFALLYSQFNLNNVVNKPETVMTNNTAFETMHLKSFVKRLADNDTVLYVEAKDKEYKVYLTDETKYMHVFITSQNASEPREEEKTKQEFFKSIKNFDTVDVSCTIKNKECYAVSVTKLSIN